MARRNLLTDSRSEDSIFQEDVARSSRERGNQGRFDQKAANKKHITTGVVLFIGSYLILGFFFSIMEFQFMLSVKDTMFFDKLAEKFKDITMLTLLKYYYVGFGFRMFLNAAIAGTFTSFAVLQSIKRTKKKALSQDHTDINTYKGDRHILTLEELITQYQIFPDAGAHSKSVSPAAIIGHFYLENSSKLPKVKLAKRNPDTGEFIKDEKGQYILEEFPMFDDNLRAAAYSSVGVKSKADQIAFDPFSLKHKKIFIDDENHKKAMKKWEEGGRKGDAPVKKNTGKFRWMTVGDFIKEDWYIPSYENQRPAGAFLVETGAVNTFAIAITRGNKGQLVVNNTIDMLSREHDLQNMFVNDPKGELFAGFHKMLEMRGYEVIVLNLMEPQKTHQFNVLAPAIAMARIGNYDKMRDLLSTIMNAFFPVEGDDPFWGNAQQTLVKMIIFSMIDYYLEEERAYLQKNVGILDESTIGRDLDDMWSHVTMFNAYQMLTTMSREEEMFELKEPDDEYEAEENEEGEEESGAEQMTKLTAFFKLLDALPKNKMRTIAMQQIDAMDLMAESEKTRATVYGIALVAMLFFTDGPITAITSASPRQSLDTVSLAFPRRLRFRVNSSFLKAHKLAGKKVIFESYYDEAMEHKLDGKDFAHETKLDPLGWVEYRFKGIYENYDEFTEEDGSVTKIAKPVYIKMTIKDNTTGYVLYQYSFKFSRGHARTVDGRKFVQNPRTGERIEQGGTLRQGTVENGKFVLGQTKVKLVNGMTVLPIEQTDPVYNIRPKAIFSITPPHLTDYIKVVIVMVAVLFDTSVGEAYITKEDGKPFYKTRNILDELGNMQFNGNGIPEFQTKLSIGLGQGQEYTMILQTLQQLKDVYGDSVDKIVSSNTAIFVYLISNDTDMLEELSKQAGNTHVTRASGKNISKEIGTFHDSTSENVSYSYSTTEERLFTVDELMSFTNGESMVLSTVHRADNSGEAVRPNPIYNTKESLLPMAYALHKDGHANKKVFATALQNAEVATSATDRDIYQTIPNFTQMYNKRFKQALLAEDAKLAYMSKHHYTEQDLLRKDVDVVAEEIMRIINVNYERELAREAETAHSDSNEGYEVVDEQPESQEVIENMEAGLSDEERSIESKTSENAKETMQNADVKLKQSAVADKDKMYKSEIESSAAKEMKVSQAENEKVYLDGLLSYRDLLQRTYVMEAMSEALDHVQITDLNLNTSLYKITLDGLNKSVYDKTGRSLYMELRKDDSSTEGSSWIVTDAWIEKLLTIALPDKNAVKVTSDSEINTDVFKAFASEVESYFEVDGNGAVKAAFETAYKQKVNT